MGCLFIILLLIGLVTIKMHCGSAQPPSLRLRECRIGSDVYAVGDAFYPVIRAQGTYYTSVCTKCTCRRQFIPQCEKVSCPPLDCENPVRTEGQCCAVCPQENQGEISPSQCIFNGLLIDHGHTFHPSLLNPQPADTSNPYCTSCTCTNGLMSCKNNSLECPALDCQEPAVLPEGTCCPMCPTPSVTTSVPAPDTPVCRDIDGRTFMEGEQWHPSYPFYGLVTCINCTCVNSEPQCEKLPCPKPEGPLPPCGPDEPNIVLCCPTCERVPHATTTSKQPSIHATTSEAITTVTIPPVVLRTCPKAYSIKVWKDRQRDALALEDTSVSAAAGSTVVTIWSWQAVNGSYSYTTTTATVANIQLTTNYTFVGWTKPARIRRLSTAPKQQKINRCTSNCHSVLSQLLRVRQDCDGDR